jgi:hypothetical protein
MIYRIAITWFLVATMLLCPFICMANASVTSGATKRGQLSRCCCCPCSDSEKSGNAPCKQGSKEQGGTCLCHGAVLQSPTVPSNPNAGPALFVLVDDFLPSAKSVIHADSLFTVVHHSYQFPTADSGREVRALIESYLL